MNVQDPIADMLTRIRNGLHAKHVTTTMPSSKLKIAIAKVLEDEGYINGFSVTDDKAKSNLTIDLKYHQGVPVIEGIKRISKPSLRLYKDSGSLPRIRGGLGISIISTSKGVMSDSKARKAHVGGEILCEVI